MQKKILIVDDDAELVELLRFNLKKAGFSIGTAANGAEALKKARSIRPNLIVLDVMMPELDGFSVCEILRREKATASIPIIMLTALASEFGRLTSLEAGATEFLAKPFSPKAVVTRVKSLLKEPEPNNRCTAFPA
ncbi:MAG TPA: response regulator [Candidatus Paceibacterota bacterium]|nr:response regulator [Candidatus Paceibacterota bacterium]